MHPQPPKLPQPPSAGTAEHHPFVPGLREPQYKDGNLTSQYLLEYPLLKRLLGKGLIYEDNMVNMARSSSQGSFSAGICLAVGKQGYKFDWIFGLYRAKSSAEPKLRLPLVNKFVGLD